MSPRQKDAGDWQQLDSYYEPLDFDDVEDHMTMTEATDNGSAVVSQLAAKAAKKKKPAAKKKPAKAKKKPRPKVKTKKKGAAFTWKGPGGARERKRQGIHLLIIRVPVGVVKRLDAKLKKAGRTRDRGNYCAELLTRSVGMKVRK